MHLAAGAGVDFLVVHHGLFWSGLQPVTGPAYRKLAAAAPGGPGDLQRPPALWMCILSWAITRCWPARLNLENTEPFFFEKGRFLGLKARVEMDLPELVERLETAVGGPVKALPGRPAKRCARRAS